jgi:hypothetical protein
VLISVVRQIQKGNDEPQNTHILKEDGFGTIEFGTVLADTYNRRVTMARVRMGSDPGGDADYCGVETNGIWK